MSNFQLERSQVSRTSFAFRRTLRYLVALVLAGTLLFAALPVRIGAQAPTKQGEQSLNSLIGLLLEADSIAKTEMMPSELKSIREAASHARKGTLGSSATVTEMQRARTMLRRIIEDPRGESTEFQEKIANSLKLVEDYLAIGDGNGLRVRTDTAFGLITTTFDTLEGTVSVNLPDDVASGDTISGTVIAEPKGTTKDEQAKNEDSLNGYVVEVAKQETPPQQKQGSKWVIPPAAQFIPVVLKNREGKEVARTNVPLSQGHVVNPKPNGDLPQDGSYTTPPFGQAGRPVSVAGPFDGDFANTAIKLGNNTAQFLAESPRKAVVRSPANLTGPATIEVNEQGKLVAKCHYQSIGVRLAADKLNLIRGEQTVLTVTLSGLNGVGSPVPLQLTNATPWTVRMEGGESQTITARPQEFTGGVFTTQRMLTGVRAGGFTINAVVSSAMLSPGAAANWKTCDGGTAGGPDRGTPRDLPEKKPPVGKPIPTTTGTDDLTVATRCSGPGGKVEVAPTTFQDISPDSEFGANPQWIEKSGPVSNIVADPKDPNVVYVAAWYAGVWKSTDGARTWKPANRGLATPFAFRSTNRALAIDDKDSQRLLFAAEPEDLRTTKLGGLWFSPDAAGHWLHVDLPSCPGAPDASVSALGFTGGVAFAKTKCGIFVAKADPAATASWAAFPFPPGVGDFGLIGASSRLYTCRQNKDVTPTKTPTTTVWYQAIGSAAGSLPWTFAASLPLGPCYDLAVAPDDPDELIVALGPPLKVWRARVGSSINGAIGEGFTFPTGGGGSVSLHVARRPSALSKGPGLSYDLFIADQWVFRQYEADKGRSGNWTNQLKPGLVCPAENPCVIHVDTHTMAFPSTYDPEKGNCTAWAATDGGVYATTTRCDDVDPDTGKRRETWNSGWRHASHGLHIMVSAFMAGVRSCDEVNKACPAIYLPTDHDDMWVSLSGGRSNDWRRMYGLGDAGSAMIDPALPGQMLGARGGTGNPFKVALDYGDMMGNLNNSSGSLQFGGGANLTLAQIMTLTSGDDVAPKGDYVSLDRPERAPSKLVGPGISIPGDVLDPSSRFDVIVRNQKGSEEGWEQVAIFERDAVAALAVSGGHKKPVFYVLTHGGDVFVLCSSSTAPSLTTAPLCAPGAAKSYGFSSRISLSVWASASAGLGGPVGNLRVNPYDPQNLYATGQYSGNIKSSTDGGRTWNDEPVLKEIATNGGEFRLGCFTVKDIQSEFCSLAQMIFDRKHPNYRFALLNPGGVAFSRDSGKHWIAIAGPWSYGRSCSSGPSEVTDTSVFPFVLPFSGFYDDTEDTIRHTSSLYVALRGRGIVRIDAPFAKLGVGP